MEFEASVRIFDDYIR
ncbi:unnamed protein product [Lathyrus sativus]|nr:unnamed protein product [Lathyrus sativus]